MTKVYVTGHKNPDMDSVCAAYSYAWLKNQIDKDCEYIPIRCGTLNNQTKFVFKTLGITPPAFMRDVYPRVADVAKRDIVTLNSNDPIYKAIKELDQRTLSMIPIFDGITDFSGIVSIHEISSFLMNDNLNERPVYRFLIENFKQVLPGYFYRTGKQKEFSASIMIGAMPYELSIHRIAKLGDTKPLLIVGMREDLLKYAVEQQFPAIILTGLDGDRNLNVDFSDYEGTIFVSHTDTAETVRLLRLSAPLNDVMNSDPIRVQADCSFEEAKRMLVNSEYRGMPVFEDEHFAGIVTRRCFIEKPKRQLILVDHNELDQSIPGAEEARIVEIIDHHRLGVEKTSEPIAFFSRPVGSTSTIIFQLCRYYGIEVTEDIATLLLSAILSDTIMTKSPTTTIEDKKAIEELSEISGRTWEEWGHAIFSHSATLKNADPAKVVEADFKEYEQKGIKFGIGQVEVLTLEDVDEVRNSFLEELENSRRQKRLDWTMLLITNVLKQDSILLMTEFAGIAKHLAFEKVSGNIWNLPGILSRKKQLLPEIIRAIEEGD